MILMCMAVSAAIPITRGHVRINSADGYFPLAVGEGSSSNQDAIGEAITRAHFEVARYRATHEYELGQGEMAMDDN